MNSSESSGSVPSEFLLMGLMYLQDQKLVVSVFFLIMYFVVILGNCTIIFLIRTDHRLHKPMHIFISLLALVDLSLSSSIFPKVLAILWFESYSISSAGCFTQFYVLYLMLGLESSLFALMSLDCYLAICHPLRHSAIMTSSFIIKAVLLVVIKCVILTMPFPILALNATFCKVNVIFNSYCEYLEVIQMTCGDLNYFIIYAVMMVCLLPVVDNIVIVFTYICILRAVFGLQSTEARWKTLNTCSAHAIMLWLFYGSVLFPLFIFLYYQNPPPHLKLLPEVLGFHMIPMINPIVYGMKTKEIRKGLKRMYWRYKISPKRRTFSR